VLLPLEEMVNKMDKNWVIIMEDLLNREQKAMVILQKKHCLPT
jgi:hypothetical protein